MTKVYSQQSVLTGRKRKMSVEMGHFAVVDPLHRWFLYTSNYGRCDVLGACRNLSICSNVQITKYLDVPNLRQISSKSRIL